MDPKNYQKNFLPHQTHLTHYPSLLLLNWGLISTSSYFKRRSLITQYRSFVVNYRSIMAWLDILRDCELEFECSAAQIMKWGMLPKRPKDLPERRSFIVNYHSIIDCIPLSYRSSSLTNVLTWSFVRIWNKSAVLIKSWVEGWCREPQSLLRPSSNFQFAQ